MGVDYIKARVGFSKPQLRTRQDLMEFWLPVCKS